MCDKIIGCPEDLIGTRGYMATKFLVTVVTSRLQFNSTSATSNEAIFHHRFVPARCQRQPLSGD